MAFVAAFTHTGRTSVINKYLEIRDISARTLTYWRSIDKWGPLRRLGLIALLLDPLAVFAEWALPGEIAPREYELAAEPFESKDRTSDPGRQHNAHAVRERLLYSFEQARDGQALLSRSANNLTLHATHDYSVTRGDVCARVTSTRPGAYAEFVFSKSAMRGWRAYNFLAIDIYLDRTQTVALNLELRDTQSRNYFTRCTLTRHARKGHQTLYWPIAELRRNGKEGLGAEQLRPGDRVAHNDITHAKLFFETPAKGTVQFWMDGIRLVSRHALYPPMPLALPGSVAAAIDLGDGDWLQEGFTPVPVTEESKTPAGVSLTSNTELVNAGSGWPDPLSGTFAMASESGILRLNIPVTNGRYRAVILAGPHIHSSPRHFRYLLRANGETIYEDLPDRERIDSGHYLHRFMWTAYSERQDGLFLDYIERMYPAHCVDVTVDQSMFRLAAKNFMVSAVILIPAEHARDADRFAARLRTARAKAFARQTRWPFTRVLDGATDPVPAALDVFVPTPGQRLHPKLRRADAAGTRAEMKRVAAPGQNVFVRLCLRADTDMGWGTVKVSDARSTSGVLPGSALRCFVSNYRYGVSRVDEGALLPTSTFRLEARVTQAVHFWWRVPGDIRPGTYVAHVEILVEDKAIRRVPLEIEILPAGLVPTARAAFGFYYKGRVYPTPIQEDAFARHLETFQMMKALGFTSITLPDMARVRSVDEKNGNTELVFDDIALRAAVHAGLGRSESQPLLLEQLSLARSIARRLPQLRGDVTDRNPGVELKNPAFKTLWMDAMRDYLEKLDSYDGHFIFEVIDEPRENPNPWNRNLADTKTYARWMGETGMKGFVTLMGDTAGGADYTELVDDVDVVSTHINPGTKRIRGKARDTETALWFFNDGMTRASWGFKPWAHGAQGRFEWHWCWPGDPQRNIGGYPGVDWHNPFTRVHGLVPNAPRALEEGAFLLSSALFDAAEGVTDYSYVDALSSALERVNQESPAACRARHLLDDIREKSISGVSRPDVWRRAIAELLSEIQKEL